MRACYCMHCTMTSRPDAIRWPHRCLFQPMCFTPPPPFDEPLPSSRQFDYGR